MAVNVGDATNGLALDLLLRNTSTLGVRKELLVLRDVERMARESAEGQAIELDWIAAGRFDLSDRDYVRMAYKKTCWYGGRALRHRRRVRAESHRLRRRRRADRGSRDRAGLPAAFADREHAVRRRPEGLNHTP